MKVWLGGEKEDFGDSHSWPFQIVFEWKQLVSLKENKGQGSKLDAGLYFQILLFQRYCEWVNSPHLSLTLGLPGGEVDALWLTSYIIQGCSFCFSKPSVNFYFSFTVDRREGIGKGDKDSINWRWRQECHSWQQIVLSEFWGCFCRNHGKHRTEWQEVKQLYLPDTRPQDVSHGQTSLI